MKLEQIEERIDSLLDELMANYPTVTVEGIDDNKGHFATVYFGDNFVAWADGWDDEMAPRFCSDVSGPVLNVGGYVFYPRHLITLEKPAATPVQLELF